MKKFKVKSIVAIALSALIGFNVIQNLAPVVNANAQSIENPFLEYSVKDTSNTLGEVKESVIDDETFLRAQLELKNYSPNASIDKNSFYSKEIIDQNGEAHKLVGYNLIGKDIDSKSSATQFILDENNNITNTGTVLCTIDDNNNQTGQIIVDNKKVIEAIGKQDGTNMKIYRFNDNGDRIEINAPKATMACLTKCLENAGLSNFLMGLILTTCGVVCGVTLGTGCVVCIVGLGVVAGNDLGHCLAVCGY